MRIDITSPYKFAFMRLLLEQFYISFLTRFSTEIHIVLYIKYEFHHDLLLSEEPKQPGHGLGKKHGRSNETSCIFLYIILISDL